MCLPTPLLTKNLHNEPCGANFDIQNNLIIIHQTLGLTDSKQIGRRNSLRPQIYEQTLHSVVRSVEGLLAVLQLLLRLQIIHGHVQVGLIAPASCRRAAPEPVSVCQY